MLVAIFSDPYRDLRKILGLKKNTFEMHVSTQRLGVTQLRGRVFEKETSLHGEQRFKVEILPNTAQNSFNDISNKRLAPMPK